jgi:enoyl-CoA hydratase/carnithine racemase
MMLETMEHGSVRELRMNRPPVNALSAGMIAALRSGVSEAIEAGVGAIVLSGQPGMFSAGLDVPSLIQFDRSGIRQAWGDFFALLEIITRSPIPVVAAITGHSPAGGAVMALFCDYRVMAEGPFKIGLNEVEVGITLPPLIQGALRRQVGPSHAERLGVAGMLISVEEAHRVNLVDEVTPLEDVVSAAVGRCQLLLALPPTAMAESRRGARADLVALFEALTEQALDDLVDHWMSEETQRALKALIARLAAK